MKQSSNISQIKTTGFNPFNGTSIERIIHTTNSQAEIWIACKMGGDEANKAYNESVTLDLFGSLNESALNKAINTIVERHESLRSVFSSDGKYMTIFEFAPVKIIFKDVSNSSEQEAKVILQQCVDNEANYLFDLNKGPLFKVTLIKVADKTHHLILSAHHIICDGWSFGIMLEELAELYQSIVDNKLANLPEVNAFSSYADHELLFNQSDEYKKIENYWINQFKNDVPQLNMPTDFPRPELRSYISERLDFEMDAKLVKDLKATGVKAGASFVTTLLGAFEIFLHTQTGQEELVVGLPSVGQSGSGMTQLIGHCVNLLPIRSKVDTTLAFKDYLKFRKPDLLDAFDNVELTFGELLKKLKIARDQSLVPLVPVIFNIDFGMSDQVKFADLEYELHSNPRAYEAFEIFLNATGSGNVLVLEWSYNSALFKRETITKMMDDFQSIISSLIESPEASIASLIKIDTAPYDILNDTKRAYPDAPLHELILDKATRFRTKDAISIDNKTLNYNELSDKINRLSSCLRQQGVDRGSVVGVCLSRSTEMVVTLLSILKCGGIYLPLDPNFPVKRLNYMLEDSKADFLITSESIEVLNSSKVNTLHIESLFKNLSKNGLPEVDGYINHNAVAYILYTSGSTGNPKGVQITHKSLVNFLYGMIKAPGISDSDRLLSITTISFDIAGLELYLPLLVGATLVIANDKVVKDSRILLEQIEREKITIVQATPSSWQMMLSANWEKPLPIKALCGGENLPITLAKKLLTKVDSLWNLYGPTETTIWSTVKEIKENDDSVSIGRPIANTEIYIVNGKNALVAPNSVGEICIAGAGVAVGYLYRPDLTSEKFIDDPFSNTGKLYKTGDLGKLLPNGELQCLGRIDQQVKLRGHRIELEEIESALDSYPSISSSVVLVKNENLIGYVVVKDKISQNLSSEDLKLFLEDKLPTYMVPQSFKVLDTFPKTLNGKIDRKSLQNLSELNQEKQRLRIASTPNEILVSNIWKEALGLSKIDLQSDFFELGGHSLIAVQVMSRIEKKTGKRLPLSALMVYPTIEKLAAFITSESEERAWGSLVPIKPNGTKKPIYIVHGAGHNVLFFNSLAKNLDEDQPVFGLQAIGLNGKDKPYDKIEDMAAHYISEIVQNDPVGPYALSGYSFGGIIAYEMARQLKAQNKEVKTVAMIDSYVFPEYYFNDSLTKQLSRIFYTGGKVYFAIARMFRNWKEFKFRINVIARSIGQLLGVKPRTLEQEAREELHADELDKMHNKAVNRYQILAQDIKVDLLVVDHNVYFKHDKTYYGWKRLALVGIERHIVPGNHGNLFSPPYDKALGRTLQDILDRPHE